jgi:hypothetical protein
MSIDANVVGITWTGTIARLTLEQPDRSRCAGQNTLDVHYPPVALPTLLNRHIWGGSDSLMCGETKIGKRVGYGACELDNAALLDLPHQPERNRTC